MLIYLLRNGTHRKSHCKCNPIKYEVVKNQFYMNTSARKNKYVKNTSKNYIILNINQ